MLVERCIQPFRGSMFQKSNHKKQDDENLFMIQKLPRWKAERDGAEIKFFLKILVFMIMFFLFLKFGPEQMILKVFDPANLKKYEIFRNNN